MLDPNKSFRLVGECFISRKDWNLWPRVIVENEVVITLRRFGIRLKERVEPCIEGFYHVITSAIVGAIR